MIDAGLDRTTELSDRQRSVAEARRTFQARPQGAVLLRRGRLTAEEASVRRAVPGGGARGTLAVTETTAVPARAPEPTDPGMMLRTGVRGVLGVAVLALLLLWVRQRAAAKG